MLATQASSLVISLWPLSRASQFGHFFNKYFLGAYHALGPMLSAGSEVNKRDTAPPSWNLPWIQGMHWIHTRKSLSRNSTSPSSMTGWHRAQGWAAGHSFPGIWILPRTLLQFLFPRTLWVLQSYPGNLRYRIFLQMAIYWLPIRSKH